ncbi:hypothetical protein CTEN210_03991 [Chaetoceros tenuissimus]|uniref:Integrase catalytic domain-containing protein n=1 Tax=Chaetoceros tenuissimus TaxID=426638 RepID=A0AAD3CKC7_9STRA|nr:hypothetical protein CTEN210_03991 [Chaetoceros tenuissimus]
MGQLCDDDCTAVFTKNDLQIFKNGKLLIKGLRNRKDGLWDVPFDQSKLLQNQPSANVLIDLQQSKKELASFYHGVLGGPVKTTFLNALRKGFFTNWPGLTTELISKHLDPKIYTAKGHIAQEKQGLRSTSQTDTDFLPEQETKRTHECFVTIEKYDELNGKSYSDLTGRFPIPSSRGNEYIVVIYDYDANAILAEAIPNRQAATIRDATIKMLDKLTTGGFTPKLHILDNECSALLKAAFHKHKIKFQLVPPHQKRRNAAERAIQTFKNHFITILCLVDPDFPLSEWDRLLPQTLLSLNHLRAARVNPKLSAYAALEGIYDFNRSPLAPLGTKLVYHVKPDQRSTFGTRGKEAWYVGPAPEHYRCVTIFLPDTQREIQVDTVQYFPNRVPIPKSSKESLLLKSALDMLELLKDPTPAMPALDYSQLTTAAVTKLAELLHRAAKQPKVHIPTDSVPTENVPTPSTPDERVEPSSPAQVPRVVSPTPLPQEGSTQHPAQVPRVESQRSPQPSVSPTQQPTPIPITQDDDCTPSQRLHRYNTRNKFSRQNALVHLLQEQPSDPSDMFFMPTVHHIFNEITGKKETLDTLLAGKFHDIWNRSLSNELGRLTEGIRDIKGTQTMVFIHKDQVPVGRIATYLNPVCDYRPKKDDPHRVRLTVGGDKLPYPFDASSPAAGLTDAKLIFNSTISTDNARFMSIDIKDFFLNNPMQRYEYAQIPVRWIPEDIMEKYNLKEKIYNGYVYVEIRKGMYGLKQAARIAYDRLVEYLRPHGYAPSRTNPGLWKHESKKVYFALCVDDFGVKYTCKKQVQHLLDVLQQQYPIQYDWSGNEFLGLTLDWHYDEGYVDLWMKGYINHVRHKFQHPDPKRPQHCPHPYREIRYGAKIQYADAPDESPLLSKAATREIQAIVGSLLYYARALDSTLLPALNTLSYQQSKPTETTKKLAMQLLDYVATYPDAVIRFKRSDMILYIHSDAAYLVLPKARSRIAGYYFLSNNVRDGEDPPLNGAVLVECKKLDPVASSSAESETGGLYNNAQNGVPMRNDLEFLDHPQPDDGTPLVTDNASSHGLLTKLMKPKRAKAWDMRYHWLEDRIQQKQFKLIWRKGIENLADYFTKHHHPAVHQKMRYKYLQRINAMIDQQWPSIRKQLPHTRLARVCYKRQLQLASNLAAYMASYLPITQDSAFPLLS